MNDDMNGHMNDDMNGSLEWIYDPYFTSGNDEIYIFLKNANASELLENLQEMFFRYDTHTIYIVMYLTTCSKCRLYNSVTRRERVNFNTGRHCIDR